MAQAPPPEPSTWTRNEFLISTDKSLLSLEAINSAFDSDYMYWCTRLPEDVLKHMISSSFCFGLYKSSPSTPPTQIGFARSITDNVTFAYLTDIYILPEYTGLGLGGWLIGCIDEYLSQKPYMRWTMLRTGKKRSREAYEKRMGMVVLGGTGEDGPFVMGKKGPGCWP